MKALTFIDFYALMLVLEKTTPIPKEAFHIKTLEYWKVVAQPFSNDAIFSVFDKFNMKGSLETKPLSSLLCYPIKGNSLYIEGVAVPVPNSIDNFVLYCSLAGVELHFKEDIASSLSTENFNWTA